MTDADIVQGSDEWRQARCGSLGASDIADMVARTKAGWGASRANLAARLIAERLTGIPQETYQSAAMQHGIETEPAARVAYAFLHDAGVVEVGIVRHPTIAHAHASPDGLVGEEGLLEVKCPNTATHLDTLLSAPIDLRYVKQCMWQMACSGRRWCDWVSFDPRLPEPMQMVVKRVVRDDEMIAELEREATVFLGEVADKVRLLTERYLKRDAA
jgi:putative phage-type endonuclease